MATQVTLNRSSIIGIFAVIMLALVAVVSPMLVEVQDAKDIMVIQYPNGKLEVFNEPGPHAQWFGKVTTYPRQSQYAFCSIIDKKTGQPAGECDGANSTGKSVRFSEGGTATLNGSVNWEMPIDPESVLKIHRKFNSPEAVEKMAVGKMLDAATYFSGPLMTSTESSGARRGELVQYINDQAEHGIYTTESKQIVTKDAAGQPQTVTVTNIVRDSKGLPARNQGSILDEFHIKLQPLAINALDYDPVVEKQIADRQKATTDVQLKIAASLQAEQDAKTVEAQGRATAAQAKWAQETIKAKEVTLAQQKFEVATLAAKEAEQYKRQQILIGEGNATKAKLEMQANGALEQKLDAYIKVNAQYADAIAKHQGPLVPSTIIGSAGGAQGNSVQNLMEMLQVKTARDLSLDMAVKK